MAQMHRRNVGDLEIGAVSILVLRSSFTDIL